MLKNEKHKMRQNLVVKSMKKLKIIDASVVHTMMKGVYTKLRKIADNGPLVVE
jgi:hypothetical protein